MNPKDSTNPDSLDKPLTLVGHLQELRSRVIKSIFCILICFVFIFSYAEDLLLFLVKPIGRLVFIAPQEAFTTNIKIVFLASLFLSSPFIIYQIWKFVSVGLMPRERKFVLIFGPLSFVFFILGAGFGYFIIVPIGLRFLLSFATEFIPAMITLSKYISFLATLVFAFAIVFQLPLISLFLTKIGIVTPRFLSEKRRHAVVFIFIIAAMLTPPDVITQILMALPLLFLYEIGIIFSKLVYHSA
ncbi:MAG: twin-arginine translocase subunit TatC [Candidatus Omnitrophica bacterium]|nr:twin-arginine translocase subunit TatC [Candidatus Omnitrophota bacterium]